MKILNLILSNHFFFSLILITVALFLATIAYLLIEIPLKKIHLKTIFNKIELSTIYLHRPLRSLVPAIFLLIVSPALRLHAQTQYYFNSIVIVWLIASAGWLLIGVIRGARESLLKLYDIKASDNLKARSVYTQINVIENIVIALIVFLTIVFILMSFDGVRQIGTSLLASAGLFGMIMGLAAQKTLGNFIAGIQIAFAQPIRIDDVVIIENEWGRIEEITLTYVVVCIWDLRRLVIPISYFIENPFQNWTRSSANILGSVLIYVDYTIPIDKIRAELTRILENSALWDKKVNAIQVTDAKQQTIEIRALMSAKDSSIAWDLRCEVREQLITFLQTNFPESLPKTRIEINSV